MYREVSGADTPGMRGALAHAIQPKGKRCVRIVDRSSKGLLHWSSA